MKKKIKNSLFSSVYLMLAMFVLALFWTQEAKPAEIYKWRLQSFTPPRGLLFEKYISVDFVGRIKEATQGQIIITPYSAGAIVPPTEILKSVADGIVEMGYTGTGFHAGFMPVGVVADGLPMSWQGPEDLLACFWERGFGDLLREQYAKFGVHLLTVYCTDPYTVVLKKPLQTKADWKGVKIRGWGVWNKFFASLDASPVDMPLVEVYTALAMGTIDGVLTGVTAHREFKHNEVCKYGLWPPLLGGALHDMYIDLDAWNKLPADLKSKITSAARDWSYSMKIPMTQAWQEDKRILTDKGVKWSDVQDRDWVKEKAQELWVSVGAQNPVSAKAIKLMSDYLKEIGAIKR